MTGLEPRGFTWVISGRLAVSERVGGYGFQHRRVRREEEISWLKIAGVNAVLSLLPGNQNLASYTAAAKIYFRLRRRGYSVGSSVDCLIAQTAIEHGLLLLHADSDFDRIAEVAPLKIW